MYKRLLTVALSVMIIYVLLGILPIHSEADIYDSVLRFHVRANSDSAADQELKLAVRDSILNATADIFKDCKTKEEAYAAAKENLSLIKKVAEQTVKEAGYDYEVTADVYYEKYPQKSYESYCFPSGEYASLQVKIGEAEGENWWCVLFPPMCVSAASDGEAIFTQAGISSEQYDMITQTNAPKYKIRFKLLETIENTFGS